MIPPAVIFTARTDRWLLLGIRQPVKWKGFSYSGLLLSVSQLPLL